MRNTCEVTGWGEYSSGRGCCGDVARNDEVVLSSCLAREEMIFLGPTRAAWRTIALRDKEPGRRLIRSVDQ